MANPQQIYTARYSEAGIVLNRVENPVLTIFLQKHSKY